VPDGVRLGLGGGLARLVERQHDPDVAVTQVGEVFGDRSRSATVVDVDRLHAVLGREVDEHVRHAPLAHRGEAVRRGLDRAAVDLVDDLRRLGEEVVGEGHVQGS
jgi:hypothetical protein